MSGPIRTMKVFLAMGAVVALALPLGTASADHCNEVQVISSRRTADHDLFLDPGTRACELPGEHREADLIMPGSTGLYVRRVNDLSPTGGTIQFAGYTGGPIQLPTQACTEETPTNQICWRPLLINGAQIAWQTSDFLRYTSTDRAVSVNGGRAVVTVCIEDNCQTRTYRTVA